MTNPYSMQSNPYAATYSGYPQEAYSKTNFAQENYPANIYPTKKSGPSTFGMMTLGAIGGGTVGFFKNRQPVTKDGNISDTFVKEVFENDLAQNRSASSQNFFKQLKDVLKKIDKADSSEKFKNLLKENKEIIEDQCKGISFDTFIDAVNSTNLKDSKKSLKDALEGIMNFELQKTKNAIKLGWNTESKKFVKTPEFKDSKLFNTIKSTKNNGQWKKALKYGGITAGIMGALTVGYKMLTSRN